MRTEQWRRVWLLCWLLVWRHQFLFGHSYISYPITDIIHQLSDEERLFTERYRQQEQYWPEECSVFCPENIKASDYGFTNWPNGSAGYRYVNECPYTYDYREAYASRDCIPHVDTGLVGWADVNFTECDMLPVIATVYQLQELKKHIDYGDWLKESIQRLAVVLREAPFNYFTYEIDEAKLAFQVAYFATNDYQLLVDDIPVTYVLDLFAAVLSLTFSISIENQKEVPFHVHRIFNNLPSMLREANVNGSVISTRSSIGDPNLLSYEAVTVSHHLNTSTFFFDHNYGAMSISYELCEGCAEYNVNSMVVFSPVFAVSHRLSASKERVNATYLSLFPGILFTEVIDNEEIHFLPLVVIEFDTLTLNMYNPNPSTFSNTSCAWNFANKGFYDLELWNSNQTSESPCQLTVSGDYRVVCRCRGSGYFGIITDFSHTFGRSGTGSFNDTEFSTLAVFLGFSFRREMWIIGMILQAISLSSLIATVITFAVFKKARHGRTTGLLMNLCLSLIGMDVVLFVAPMFSSGHLGCMVCNLMRFYFIMASLLWNGAEAYNMYLMLIKVLGHGVADFVVKAAIVSWGLPLFIIGAVIITDKESFNGFYEDCKFRCALRDDVLLYAFIFPLSAILAHNLVVFGLVMRVLKQPRLAQEAEDPRATTWTQLLSSLTLLALLGLPWIFSAFGALDINRDNGHLDRTEVLLHLLFLVGVNLQGVFIFSSQCLHRPDIRHLWSTALTYTAQTQAGTQSSQ